MRLGLPGRGYVKEQIVFRGVYALEPFGDEASPGREHDRRRPTYLHPRVREEQEVRPIFSYS